MRRIPPILPALLLLLPAASPAEPLAVHEWDARPADPRPYAGRVPHGSAARLVARLPGPVASASFHWQTNGMGGLWWDAPAECSSNAVSVVWTPAMDTGADEVHAFFRIEQPEGPDYGAFCHLAMLDSPGFAPNALPMPVQTLDFEAVAWTNAPWALPSDIPPAPDLSEYATTGQVASAIAAIPVPEPPDLSAYATTGLVSSLHPPFEEWAAPAFDRIEFEASADSTVYTQRLDALALVGVESGRALRAVRSSRSGGMASETELDGAWSLVSETDSATLVSNVLRNTSRPGLATVEFAPADGAAPLRSAVPMSGDARRTATVWPTGEISSSWRDGSTSDSFLPNGYISVTTSLWNNVTYVCTNWVSAWSEGPRPPPAWYAAPAVDSGGGLVGLAPHYALSSAHCGEFGPKTWATGTSSGRGVSVAIFGDLRLLRMPSEVPTNCVARLLRSSVLSSLSESLLFRALGNVHTQHGCVLPCLLEPRNRNRADLSGLNWDNGWTYIGSDREWLNTLYRSMRRHSHAAHRGDSGHPVWFRIWNAAELPHDIPVGLFHTANGGGECLLSDALLDRIDDVIRRDSGNAESLSFYTAEELQ